MIVISPYGVVHAVSHERTEHSSIIKFIDKLYKLTPLADLPDEAAARKLGESELGQKYLGPADAGVAGVGNLFSAFDNNRLLGSPCPRELVCHDSHITDADTSPIWRGRLPHHRHHANRYRIGWTVFDPAPSDFNPRPSTNPGIPTAGGWTP